MARAIVVSNDDKYMAELTEVQVPELKENQVLVQSLFSGINYKDALAVTGKGKILKKFPLIPGIDVCGHVIKSKSEIFKEEDIVFQIGCDLGEKYNGGFCEQVILDDKNCLTLPSSINPVEVMAMGTAGFTAALAIYKMELNGLDNTLPVLVTGASGGVGNYAVQMLSQKEYKVVAMSGKLGAHAWLKGLGADQVITPEEMSLKCKPLESVQWSGCIDNVGGEVLSNVIPQIQIGGEVACVGLAGGYKLNTTVMPFILRGVNLLGVSSNNCPMPLRKTLWQEIGKDKPQEINSSQVITLEEVPDYCQKLLERKIAGRILIQFPS